MPSFSILFFNSGMSFLSFAVLDIITVSAEAYAPKLSVYEKSPEIEALFKLMYKKLSIVWRWSRRFVTGWSGLPRSFLSKGLSLSANSIWEKKFSCHDLEIVFSAYKSYGLPSSNPECFRSLEIPSEITPLAISLKDGSRLLPSFSRICLFHFIPTKFLTCSEAAPNLTLSLDLVTNL